MGKAKADIGLIGIAVMGENLVLNMESKGFKIAVFNRTVDKVENFVNGRGKGKNIVGCSTVEELVDNLASPRKIMLMVKAGKPIDDFIERLIPLLDKGDIIIDGGNSHFPDTIRRTKYLESKGMLFIGTGVSGGEEGALLGPSIMPGGSAKAWPAVKPIFQAISAKVDDGTPCCEWVGSDGAGHYVKTVHNGIEYGDMQMICEAYTLMKNMLGMNAKEMQKVFAEWNAAELDSYLIDITANILKVVDEKTQNPLVEMILDTAGQKGTGKWTSMSALDLGAPSPTIAEAVFARCVSAIKAERVAASKILKGPEVQKFSTADKDAMINKIRKALYASKICSYAQGFQLLTLAAEEYGWKLNFGEIALMWRGGCIIRARFLGDIKEAFEKDPKLANLLLADFFKKAVEDCQSAWREVVAAAAINGIPVPAFSSALSYYDSYRSAVLPANLLQAQRDYFGAHTFERIDEPRGKFFHHEWTETSGSTTSTTYNA
ncbi:MAG: decarboxylating NADP(+)-dependent phosphogluconate dehydrogenase [Victivallaceae bacterium]|nr:decarboxylating NADP(+)-dependent phosphogluconate dehydrogenase [Victivallaceae bacterium]